MRFLVSLLACGIAIAFVTPSAHGALLTAGYEAQLEAWLGGDPLDFTNIYTKAAGHTADDFHAAADGQGRTFVLLEAREQGTTGPWQIIGGYNPYSWSTIEDFTYTIPDAERTAFLFNLSTGDLQLQKLSTAPGGTRGTTQAYNSIFYGPTFGNGFDLGVESDLSTGYAYSYSYGTAALPGATNLVARTLSGSGSTDLEFRGLEAYTLAPTAAVPEPSSLALLATGGLIGAVRHRRRRRTWA